MHGLNERDSALFTAAAQNDRAGVQAALDAGANVHARNEKGQTPLHVAALHAQGGVVQLLLDHDANPNAFDDRGETPLHVAVSLGKFGVCDILLTNDANIEAQRDFHSPTPLFSAFNADSLRDTDGEHMRYLLEKGANPQASIFRIGKYWTILDILQDKKSQTVRDKKHIELLKEFMAGKTAHDLNSAEPKDVVARWIDLLVQDKAPASAPIPAPVKEDENQPSPSLQRVQEIARQSKNNFRLKK